MGGRETCGSDAGDEEENRRGSGRSGVGMDRGQRAFTDAGGIRERRRGDRQNGEGNRRTAAGAGAGGNQTGVTERRGGVSTNQLFFAVAGLIVAVAGFL